MTAIPSDTLLTQLNWRYATKKFDPTRKIPLDSWAVLESVLILTPSSHNLQPWRFVVITDENLRQELKPLSWGQPQVTDCSHLVVFAAKNALSETDVAKLVVFTTETRGQPRGSLSGTFRSIVKGIVKGQRRTWVKEWLARQTYVALGNLLTSAALMGIDTCPLEAIDPEQYDKVLGLQEKGYSTLCACALGFRANDDPNALIKKVRYPASELIEKH